MNKVSNSDFATKRMNLPQGDADSEVTSWDNILATDQQGFDFDGMPCVVGIDYASTTDFVSAGFLFWKDGKFLWHTHSWVCSNSKDLSRIKPPLREWEKQGLLTFVDALEVNPTVVTSWIRENQLKHKLSVKRVCIDKFRYTLMSKALGDIGFSAIKKSDIIKQIRPSDEMMIMPTITSNFVNHNIVWGNNPLMRWYCNNSKIERVGINYIYSKIEPKSRKTDGFKAFVAAMTESNLITKNYSSGEFSAYIY
jgi:phage terminase large subunit-like protein